jgi:15-cis-phytoene synthase
MKALFDLVSYKTSEMVTRRYSTSFSLGIKFLCADFHRPIYGIYGFVRFADEIVDTFHDYNKKELLDEFKRDTYLAIERGISLNPVLNSFQAVVNKYKIDIDLIETFLKSMEMDLEQKDYTLESYKEYILGSAEVVGLMCLKVFVEGNAEEYESLKPFAMALGSAFQKINFLRDINADYIGLGRIYFPQVDISKMDSETKAEIELDIEADFEKGLEGIRRLSKKSRLGVYVAYMYYNSLFKKIRGVHPERVLQERIRISTPRKAALFGLSYVKHSFNIL